MFQNEYIGAVDSTGTKIHEGDTLRDTLGTEKTGVVAYDPELLAFKLRLGDDDWTTIVPSHSHIITNPAEEQL